MKSACFSSPPLSARDETPVEHSIHFSLRSTPCSSLRSTPLRLGQLANRSGRSSPACSMLGTSSFDTCSSQTWSSETWSPFPLSCSPSNCPTSWSELRADATPSDTATMTGWSTSTSSAPSGASSTATRGHHRRGHRQREEQKMKETARERSWPVLHENALVPPRFPVLVLRHVASPPPGQRVPTKDELEAERAIERALKRDERECVRLIAEAMKHGLR